MPGFDISSLLEFYPPEYLCENCSYIFCSFDVSRLVDSDVTPLEGDFGLTCPICKKFHTDLGDFIKIRFSNVIEHSRTLADIARKMEANVKEGKIPPMRLLLSALLSAESFVHLTTYGMSHTLLGALKVISQAVDVRGVVADSDDRIDKQINDYQDENPRLKLITIPISNNYRQAERIPHQKLIIIDGLLAFAGSANFTLSAWRKAREGFEHIEVMTEISKVQDLHNRLFSRTWLKFNPLSREYPDEIPF